MPGQNPFGNAANAPLPGGGGNYLTFREDGLPARHVVIVESLRFKPAGFKSTEGTVIEEFQVLKTDAEENHKVGGTYGRVYNLATSKLSLGNAVSDLAAIRSIILQRPVQPAEVTTEIMNAAYGVDGAVVSADTDPELFEAVGASGYRGQVLTAVCYNKPTQKGTPWTACNFYEPTENDLKGLEHLFAPPGEAGADAAAAGK